MEKKPESRSKRPFPKSARLLKKRDFRFYPYQKFFSERFAFYFTQKGKGRMGISISKKVLKRSPDRNRVKRLLREAFRELRPEIATVDVHIVAKEGPGTRWVGLKKVQIQEEFGRWIKAFQRPVPKSGNGPGIKNGA